MAGEAFGAKVTGLPDLRAALLAVPGKLRKRALRNALAAGAREVRNVARQAAPKLAAPVRNKSGAVIRKPGTVADALAVRTSKQAGRAGAKFRGGKSTDQTVGYGQASALNKMGSNRF